MHIYKIIMRKWRNEKEKKRRDKMGITKKTADGVVIAVLDIQTAVREGREVKRGTYRRAGGFFGAAIYTYNMVDEGRIDRHHSTIATGRIAEVALMVWIAGIRVEF